MKTDNELIAEFMGMRYRKGYGPLTGETYDEVKQTPNANWQSAYFHKSWDWLMPVVEKIESLGDSNDFVFESAEFHELMELSIKTSIVRVYWFVVEFIKWYNTQPKETTSQQQAQSE